MNNKQKLELTWIGKDQQPKLEPRILIEDPEKSYGDKHSENMLIYGDNLLALKALEQDYAGQIKCICIDPPYNTGSAFDKYDDGLEHSLWLGLMKPRLELLRNLLSDKGSIWINIDDNEVHYLKILCDEVFGRNNFVGCLPTVMNLKGNQDQFGFAGTHEYTLVYARNYSSAEYYEFVIDEDDLEKWDIDNIGYYKKGAPLRATGEESTREDRPYMFYPILIKENEVTSISENDYNLLYDKANKIFNDEHLKKLINKYTNQGWEVVLPMVDEQTYGRWRWGYSNNNIARLAYDILIIRSKGGISLYKKQRPELGDLPSKKPKSLFYKPEYSSGNGMAQIKKLFGRNTFPYPKPEELIQDYIKLCTTEGEWVLDSFLGSGTTAAVAHKLNRKWIGIELGDHCHTHCIPRLQKVCDGIDNGGISNSVNWNGGGGFKYYYLAPSLLKKDKYNNWVISEEYNAEMLAAAMAKHCGFKYSPDESIYWKQGKSTEKDFIYTTGQMLTVERLDSIHEEMQFEESLLICCKSFSKACENKYPNITLKKIPKMLLGKCEFGKEDYSLNIISMPVDPNEPDFVPVASNDIDKIKSKRKKKDEDMPDMFSNSEGEDDE